jgi:hypothetical protein
MPEVDLNNDDGSQDNSWEIIDGYDPVIDEDLVIHLSQDADYTYKIVEIPYNGFVICVDLAFSSKDRIKYDQIRILDPNQQDVTDYLFDLGFNQIVRPFGDALANTFYAIDSFIESSGRLYASNKTTK